MKVIAYTVLHYGRDYLAYAIRSVIDHIDEYWVLYTPVGSHGSRTNIPCPETRDELYAIAQKAAGDKLHWVDGDWVYEGQQREAIHQLAPDADAILVIDADEIYTPETVESFLLAARYEQARIFRVPMIHYWRSLHRCILHDPASPVRLVLPKVRSGEEKLQCPPINHLGYAQRIEIVRYKLLTHGHRNEFRRDLNWFADVFLDESRVNDLHPVGSAFWNWEAVNPLDYLPGFMQEHPYFKQDIIR